jgi:hypothetical protein
MPFLRLRVQGDQGKVLRGWRLGGTARLHQHEFPFLDRARRRTRWFKRLIVILTAATAFLLVSASPQARYHVGRLASRLPMMARTAIGGVASRAEIEADWRRHRQHGIDETRRQFREVYRGLNPPLRRFMEYAGNDPESGLFRWGNLTQTLLLPSSVFEADDQGRSYRLRPNTESLWVRNITIQRGPLTFFLVPASAELPDLLRGTTGVIVDGSVQTTNSWGLRGPEPDLSAPLRGIVLGDSYMQGLFVADHQTPPECLRNELQRRLECPVSVLNTGHLGYSPEQEYFTLLEYADRFQPHFVVLSLFANDFGDVYEVLQGKGHWEETRYWLGEIAQFCRTRRILLLTVSTPLETQITGRRLAGHYPGKLSNILECSGSEYLDPIEDFVDHHLLALIEGERTGKRPATSPLYNGTIGDGHFSPLGAEVWAKAVGRRLALLLEKAQVEGRLNLRQSE